MKIKNKERIQWFIIILGIAEAIFYFLHVIIGSSYYPGYDPLTQAVSDITAATAPSQDIATMFTQISGVCVFALCLLLCIFYQSKVNKPFRLGIYLFTAMEGCSVIGYALFPLSDSGYAGAFQDIMHIVVTVLVVFLSIAAMILIAIGCFKDKTKKAFGVLSLAALGLMFLGSIGIGVVSAYFGVAERLSVYSVVLYSAALSVFTFRWQREGHDTNDEKHALQTFHGQEQNARQAGTFVTNNKGM